MIDRPVFIAGLDRTGKTPMRIAIERSASIALSRRTELWTEHRGRDADLAEDAGAMKAVDRILADRHIAAQVHDPGRLRRDLLAGPRTFPHLFALIGRQDAERAGRRRWGNQTALIERHAAEIMDAFPCARFVHMLRDPRDRFASALAAGGIGRGGAAAAAEEWLESADLATLHAAAYPDRYAVVRFEDLARQPQATLGRIFEFIGEPAPTAEAETSVPAELASGIGVFASDLSARTIALIEARCAPLMRQHGYRVESPRLGWLDRLRLALFDRPLAAATQAAIRARSGRAPRVGGA